MSNVSQEAKKMYMFGVLFCGPERVRLTTVTGDEQKPRCANCEVKGFACKYGADLAFVSGRTGAAHGGMRQVYGNITVGDLSNTDDEWFMLIIRGIVR